MSSDNSHPSPAANEIIYSAVTEADLAEITEAQMTVFGEDIYSMLEPLEDRPPHAIRIARTVHRVRTALNSEFCKLEKATLSDRTIVGFALWQKPTRSFMPHVLIRNEANEDTQEDRDAWVGLNVEMWNMLHDHDEGALRESVMGAEPHWFLAPLFILPAYQGKGIGKELIKRVSNLANTTSPPTPLYLVSMPTATKFYQRLGFVQAEGPELAHVLRTPIA